MYSIAQQAVANGYGKIEYFRAQPITLSSRVSTTASLGRMSSLCALVSVIEALWFSMDFSFVGMTVLDSSYAACSSFCSLFLLRVRQSATAALMASSASTEQWIFTGGSDNSCTISVFLIWYASATVFPLTSSVT